MARVSPVSSNSWDVVATVKADRQYVERFIAVYRSLGASRIFLFYDDPTLSFALDGDDLDQTVCDSDHWQGRRPRAVEKRQMRNAGRAARASRSEWILHCDIDEHLFAQRRIAEVLAEVPESCGCYTALPAEAVFTSRPKTVDDVFATRCFKSLRPGWAACSSFWQSVYGDLMDLSVAGFWGHRIGKSFIRCSRLGDIPDMPIHMPSGAAYSRMRPVKSKEIVLRHYDALLPDAWLTKHADRAARRVKAVWAGEKRNRMSSLVHETMNAGRDPGALALYDRMFVISDDTLARGLQAGTLTLLDAR
jgi:hypothetical protein